MHLRKYLPKKTAKELGSIHVIHVIIQYRKQYVNISAIYDTTSVSHEAVATVIDCSSIHSND